MQVRFIALLPYKQAQSSLFFHCREYFQWSFRDFDFNLLSVPPPFFDRNRVISVHSAGDTKERELYEAASEDTRKWYEKMVVDDSVFRTHRCLPETELRDKGARASNQLAKLEGLLKHNPKKVSLANPGLTLAEIPALSVVADPSVDTPARKTGNLMPIAKDLGEDKARGYHPGPYENQGWLLERNRVPIPDREHEKFNALKGHDFR